ncbi:DUF4428 domain-containing protein [Mobiluncus curtisii]|nr:DUF4428 domain-containing protein [Mobiluncus curtisii]
MKTHLVSCRTGISQEGVSGQKGGASGLSPIWVFVLGGGAVSIGVENPAVGVNTKEEIMGLFDAKQCALCFQKAGMLTKQKLQDGFLCGDCKKKLSDLSSGWKQRTVADVNEHLALREANKERAAQFQVTRLIGTGGCLELDDTHGWFRFKIGRDYKQGNAQVFAFNELGNFYAEIHYDSIADDEDGDGIPDQYDCDSHGSHRNGMGMMGTMGGELNSQSANMFVNGSGMVQYFRSVGNQINDAGMPSEVTDITMVVGTTNRFWPEVRLRGSFFGADNDMQKLQEAQQTIQALAQLRVGAGGMGAPMDQLGIMCQPGMAPMAGGMMVGGMGMPQQGMAQPGMQYGMPGAMPMQQPSMGAVPQQGMGAQMGGAPAQGAHPTNCPACNALVDGQFCGSCGTKVY